MSSSLTYPRPVEPAAEFTAPSLLDLLARVTDHRDPRGVRHRLSTLLIVALTAILAGAKSILSVAEWVNDPANTTVTELGVDLRRRPSEATLRRALNSVDADLLDRVLGTWMRTRTTTINDRRIIAVDGKTVRGARTPSDPDSRAPHLVANYDHAGGTVLGQVQIDAKTNEIPALRDLLDYFYLADCVVTADALHCQDTTAEHIINAGGDYLRTIKGNRPSLLAWAKTKSSGRTSRRTPSPSTGMAGVPPAPPRSCSWPRGTPIFHTPDSWCRSAGHARCTRQEGQAGSRESPSTSSTCCVPCRTWMHRSRRWPGGHSLIGA